MEETAQDIAQEIQTYLRQRGVVVHLASPMPWEPGRPFGVVVFLEAVLGQHDVARACALRLPGVAQVTFSALTRAIMYVSVDRLEWGSCVLPLPLVYERVA